MRQRCPEFIMKRTLQPWRGPNTKLSLNRNLSSLGNILLSVAIAGKNDKCLYNQNCLSFLSLCLFISHLACDEERVEAAKLLVEHGASIYIENKEEKTPLQLAKGGLGNLLRRIVEG